ncbi:MAG: hypothetical protein GXO73_03375 [Calditrichaeota bacterium]|nr:hypothetical protein [Calditrichota bacterium]
MQADPRYGDIFRKAQDLHIAIVGDFYLDRYILGNMEAISREAPVPIVRIEHDEYLPGGAGNTTLNVRALGVQTCAVGVIGDDLSAEIMLREFKKRGVDTRYLLRDPNRHTPTFNKIYASSFHGKKQQVARFDQENDEPISRQDEDKIIEILESEMPRWDAVIVDDYNEVQETGVVTPRILEAVEHLSQKHGVITIGDSRLRIQRFRRFTALVPNEVELAIGLGIDEDAVQSDEGLEKAGWELESLVEAEYLVVTLGEKGARIFFREDGKTVHVPTWPARGEIDVTGAGDSFAATLATALAAGTDIVTAVTLANAAASIVVQKLHTTGTASPEEILRRLNEPR